MDLTQIRYFIALARTLNFTRAAEACNVTQPALTKSIQRLEEELGGQLLLRERSLTQLTELGRTMLPLLEQTYAAAEAAKLQAISFRRQEVSPLRIGLDGTMPISALGAVLRELAARIKGFQLTACHRPAAELNELLLRNEIDVAIVAGTEELAERVNRWVLYTDQLVVLMPEHHRLAGMAHVPLAALGAETFVLATATAAEEPPALARLRRILQLDLQPRHRGANEEQVRQIVGAGLGISVTTAAHPAAPDVVGRPLGDPPLTQPVVLAAVAGRPLTRAADVFVRLARARDWTRAAAA